MHRKLSELRSAAKIHEQKMRDNPRYRREIERTQAQADAEVEELKRQYGGERR